MIGYFETKLKIQNLPQVMRNVNPQWKWTSNATSEERGRVKVSWHPKIYNFKELLVTDQLIHGEAIQLSTNTRFLVTFVYGRNHEEQRRSLWEDIRHLSHSSDAPWCILGDFNAVIHQGDRIGDNEVTVSETEDFADCMQACQLQEFHYDGPFFTWTNKTVWSKIGRAFHNDLWYEAFSFTHVQLLPQGLLDHTPLRLGFPSL